MDTLPIEIIENIFKYLRYSDLRQAAACCKLWNDVFQRSSFMSKTCVHFKKELSVDTMNLFIRSENLYQNIHFTSIPFYVVAKSKRNLCRKDVIFEDDVFIYTLIRLFKKFSESVKCLSFTKCHLERERFMTLIHLFPNLEALEIEECIFAGSKENSLLKLKKLKKFIFKYPEDEVQRFESGNIYSSLKGLESLTKVKAQFFLNEVEDDTDGSVADQIRCVMSSIDKNRKTMKAFKVDSLTEKYLKKFNYDDESLQLEKLVIGELKIKKNENHLFDMLTNQKKIKKLEIAIDSKVDSNNDRYLKAICDNLQNLEKFYYDCSRNTDYGLEQIQNLKKLKNLVLTRNNRTHVKLSDNCFDNIYMENLKSIGIYYKELSPNSVLKITENFPNLMALNLSECNRGVTDEAVQLIFRNLRSLESLDLSKCSKLTERAFVGVQTIAKLKNLKDLVLEKCPGITDISLRTFDNPALRSLSLAVNTKVTNDGWLTLTQKCPYITWLNLSMCKNFNDESVEILTANLLQLEVLNLYKNNLLTNRSIYSILKNCKFLEDIDMTKCRGIKLKKPEYFNEKMDRLIRYCMVKLEPTDEVEEITVVE